MFRKIMIALVALVTIGTAAGINSAQARGWRGGRGYHRGGWGRGWGYRGFYRGGYYPAYGYGAYGGGCWRSVRVAGPYGWAWRRVWVCG
ncbi:MAG: sulfur globule protein precursor [Xanthobacteraceae bacterium]|nr:sulfur globule protein precursor [Xanthobacteraceae bacterium]